MKILSELPDAPAGWLVAGECHACGQLSKSFLAIMTDHADVMLLCGHCIVEIAVEYEKRLEAADSRA